MEMGRQKELSRALIKMKRETKSSRQTPADGTQSAETQSGETQADGTQSAGTQSANIVMLSKRYAYRKDAFDQLQLHEQHWLRAVAVGKTMRKAALAGRSAARIHGMWVIGPPKQQVELMPVGLRVPSKSQWPEGCVYLNPRSRRAEIVEHKTLSVTDPLSAAFEIALRHGFREGLVAMDWILRNHAAREVVAAEVEKLGPVHGIATLRSVLQHAVGNSLSPYETYARAILIEQGYDDWIVNGEFGGYLLDLRRGRFGLEIDGDVKYDGITYLPVDETILRERKREKRIQRKGMIIGRVTPWELLHEEKEFVAEVLELIELAERLGPLEEPSGGDNSA
ncbi:hypothetical protein [Corynebacterium sp. CNCTC7651]|uniref:hypothetical protein n=1 Tax=Corynebacterium sp. CNCTC7651 TaxID=2815361 RepID=UPI001F271ECE|nr:hypothetical protein [Corynebacterium sp. CNCTC7651]